MSRKLTPEEMGKNLEEFAALEKHEAEVRARAQANGERFEASEEDRARARELGRRAGEAFAKAQADAKAKAQAHAQEQAKAQAQAQARPPKVVPLRPRPNQLGRALAAAAAVLGPVGYLALTGPGPYVVAGGQDAGTAALRDARGLRGKAADALGDGQWATCLELLDVAKGLDPKGDEEPSVRDLRRVARRKLGEVDGGLE